MNLDEHIRTVKALLCGEHPVRGEPLSGNPLEDAGVLRSLSRLLKALECAQVEMGIRSSLRRRRAPWSEHEDGRLLRAFKLDGTASFAGLAADLERTPRSVAERAVRLGLIQSRAASVTRDESVPGRSETQLSIDFH